MKMINNVPKEFIENINNLLSSNEIAGVRKRGLIPERDLFEDIQAFTEGDIEGLNLIQICILKAITSNTSIILDETAMKYFEIAYNLTITK